MKNAPLSFQNKTQIVTALIICFLSIPILSFGQKNKEVNIVVSCVEYIGEGKFKAHFGYDNTSSKEVVVDEPNSTVTYNHGQSKKLGLNTFKSGIVEKAFSQVFDAHDRVQWTVVFPDGTIKQTNEASANSSHFCYQDIIPYYAPPDGGKVGGESLIGAELTSLYNKYISFKKPENFKAKSDYIFQLKGLDVSDVHRVLIEVSSLEGRLNNLLSILVNGEYGFDPTYRDPDSHPDPRGAKGWMPIGNLLMMNDLIDDLNYARPVYPGIGNFSVEQTGLTQSQGDKALRSDFARMGYNIDGSGVKIGVISNSYNTIGAYYGPNNGGADVDVGFGDLPGNGNPNGYNLPVDIFLDIDPDIYGPLSDEGRAMLQIVHDVAPGAELAFRTGFLGEEDMADGIRQLAYGYEGEGQPNNDRACDIIVDDITYITAPFFRDGVVAEAVDEVVDKGVTFFSSAGNFGNWSYENEFSPGTEILGGTAHNFGGQGGIFQMVNLKEGTYTLVFQWDDGTSEDQSTTETDMDIFLTSNNGSNVLGFNRVNTGGAPVEIVPFSVNENGAMTNIVISKVDGPLNNNPRIKYIVFRGGANFEITDKAQETRSSTIVGHANAAGSIAVGAVRFDHTPEFDNDGLEAMSFSSRGGTVITGEDIPRPDKPAFLAPNGVNTTVDLGNGDWEEDVNGDGIPDPGHELNSDPDDYMPNFFGTSASAPHAAAVAALIIEAAIKYNGTPAAENTAATAGTAPEPAEILGVLKESALVMPSVPATEAGAGFIQAHLAIMQFANPKPVLENIYDVGGGGSPTVPFTSFKVDGDYFLEGTEGPEGTDWTAWATEIYLRDAALDDSSVEFNNETHIAVSNISFLGNPEIKAFTPPKSSSQLDGGFSESKTPSDGEDISIIVSAVDIHKKYGEEMPVFTCTFLIDVPGPDDYDTFEDAVEAGKVLPEEAARIQELIYSVIEDPANNTNVSPLTKVGIYPIIPALEPLPGTPLPEDLELDETIANKYRLEFKPANLIIDKLPVLITPRPDTMTYGESLKTSELSFDYHTDPDLVIPDLQTILFGSDGSGGLNNEYTIALDEHDIAVMDGIAIVDGIPISRGIALVDGFIMTRGIAIVDGIELNVAPTGSNTPPVVTFPGQPPGTGVPNGIALVDGYPFVNMEDIVEGDALVNGNNLTINEGFITHDNSVPIDPPVPVSSGIALVDGIARGIAIVDGTNVLDGIEVEVDPDGGFTYITINGVRKGIAIVDGIQSHRGIAIVDGFPIVGSSNITEGYARVNGIDVQMNHGIPMADGIALVDGVARGIAIVDGIPMTRGIALVDGISYQRGIALVDGIEFDVDDNGLISKMTEDGNVFTGPLPNGIAIVDAVSSSRGIAIVDGITSARGIAIVDGLAMTRGIAIVDAVDFDFEVATNFMAGALVNASSARGIALVDGIGLVRGIALVDGIAQSRGIALVDGEVMLSAINSAITSGIAIVDGQSGIAKIGDVNGVPIVNAPAGEITAADAIYIYSDDDGDGKGDFSTEAPFNPIVFITGTTAGKHVIVPGSFFSKNFEFSYGTGTLTINRAEVRVTPLAGQGKIYGEGKNDPAYENLKYDVSYPVGTDLTSLNSDYLYGSDMWTGKLIRVPGENAASYEILKGSLTAGANYFTLFTPGSLFTIDQASLTVSVLSDPYSINEGDPLPSDVEFDYQWPDTYDWVDMDLPPDAPDSIHEYEALLKADPLIEYVRTSDETAGEYWISPVSINSNYLINFDKEPEDVNGTLWVNPYGPGTKAIKPVLDCVEEILEDIYNDGKVWYTANFRYKNDNTEAVYIPLGDDNYFNPQEGHIFYSVDEDGNKEDILPNQPTLFDAGGGEFKVDFQGDELRWSVNSQGEDHKVSNAASANSNSTKCGPGSTKSASIAAGLPEEDLLGLDDLMVYPNPVTDKVNLRMRDIGKYKMLMLLDVTGRAHPITSIKTRSDRLEIDLSHLASGPYFFRVIMEETTRVIPVIKN